MSFIHDALKKAQQRKDGSYSGYEKLITDNRQPAREKRPGKYKWVFLSAGLLVLVFGAFIIYQESSGIYISARKSTVNKTQTAERTAPASAQPQAPPVSDTAALYREALNSQLANDNAKAGAIYRQIIAANPDHVDALNNLGVILLSGSANEASMREAIDLFNKAISLKPDFADAYYNLACSYAKLNQPENGLQLLEHAILIKPELAAFAAGDSDLQNLRSSPKFKKVINEKSKDRK